MGNFTYENQGANTFLVYTLAENELLDSLSLGMITNNKITGLASTMFTQMNATKYIKYNISSKIPMSQFFTGLVNRRRLLGAFIGVVDAMLSAEEYMIDTDAIIIDEDFIYADVSTCETVLICLPVEGDEQSNVELSMFFKNIMFKTQFDQTEDCNYVTKIINYLNGAYMFSLESFGELLRSLKGEETAVHPEALHVPDKQPEPKGAPQPVAHKPMDMDPFVPIPPAKDILPDSTPNRNEKSMSLLYLLRHYDKENANIYKAQKAQKTEKKERGDSKKSSKKEKAPAKAKAGKTKQLSSFAIPGQDGVAANIPASAAQSEQQQTPRPVQQPKQPDSLPISQQSQSIAEQISLSVDKRNPEVDFGDTIYADGTDVTTETTMLENGNSSEQQMRPYLIRKKNNERIPVNKPLFRLGRNREFNDYVVDGNGYVGGSHCHIISKNGEYFIVDDNSKNHTYVDGVMIPSGSEVKMIHGQNLKIANEEFEFRLF